MVANKGRICTKIGCRFDEKHQMRQPLHLVSFLIPQAAWPMRNGCHNPSTWDFSRFQCRKRRYPCATLSSGALENSGLKIAKLIQMAFFAKISIFSRGHLLQFLQKRMLNITVYKHPLVHKNQKFRFPFYWAQPPSLS